MRGRVEAGRARCAVDMRVHPEGPHGKSGAQPAGEVSCLTSGVPRSKQVAPRGQHLGASRTVQEASLPRSTQGLPGAMPPLRKPPTRPPRASRAAT